MSDKNTDQIKILYVELAKVAPSQDWERILKIAKKILGLSVTEKKAFQCKIVCLIHLDKFDEALTSIERNPDASDLYFEKAYCEYRLNKIEDAYSTLKQCEEMGNKEKELLAQVCYRLEKYNESYDAYRDLVKNIDDDFTNERQTNLAAVVSAWRSVDSNSKDLNMSESENETYELCYNSACISLSKGNFEEAKEKLRKAEQICKNSFEDNPEDQEVFESEIVIIRVQLAFCLQKLGKTDDALKIYNSVLKAKSGDVGVTAVASNNLVCINKDQNVFDSKKRIKAATGSELDMKLNSMQRRLISYNEILFSILTNQKDMVKKLLEQFKAKFNDKERVSLLEMSQLIKEKKYAEAEKLLNDISKSSSKVVKYYLIQTLLLQGKLNEAVQVFKELDEYKTFKLGIVSALVTILKSKNDKEKIASLLSAAVEYFNKTNLNAKELEIYVRENSNYQIECGNHQKACEMLEKMRSMKPKDFRILSKLINVYSKFDIDKANRLSKELPSLEEISESANVDIDLLENQFSLLNSKYSKKTTLGTGKVQSPDSSKAKVATAEKIKKKKKKKVRLPKNYDPNAPIDLERWLPLKERSYYKGKRNKKKNQNAVGRGTQGAVSKEATAPQSPKPAAAATTASNTPDTDKVNKPKLPPSAIQKKKKKGGSKW